MQVTSTTLTPEQIKRLAKAGVTVEQLAVMVEIMMERDAVTVASCLAPRPKSKEALRSKAYRDRKRLAENQAEDGSSVTPSRSLATTKGNDGEEIDNNNSLPKDSEKEGKGLVVAREARRGTRLPADFVPDHTVEAKARKLNFTRHEWEDWQEEFRDYWSSRSGREACKTDWQATARNSISRFDRTSRRKGSPNGYNARDSFAQAIAYRDRVGKDGEDGGSKDTDLLPRLREDPARVREQSN